MTCESPRHDEEVVSFDEGGWTVRMEEVPPLPGPYFESDKTATNCEPAGSVNGNENEVGESLGGVMFW